jgi:hypothetical protein
MLSKSAAVPIQSFPVSVLNCQERSPQIRCDDLTKPGQDASFKTEPFLKARRLVS